ncbi:MAG TPA: GNAT family N-acetyltransferase [Pseudomonadales bacterium]|jgi:phosphinothricin acetyltransferase|nr:GNAT family N-acetyltransferase [Pseudomonadales bacterium]
MQIVHCDHDAHAEQILAILNEVIANSTALYDYKPRTLDSMAGWFGTKDANRFPVIGAIDDGRLAGFASYGTFRAWPAYKYSVEHSVYVHRDHRGKGLGKVLMQHLIEAAVEQQYHVMIGAIDVSNANSIRLHEQFGFVHAGTVRHAGFKFGRWLDVAFYQRILDTPAHPVDD